MIARFPALGLGLAAALATAAPTLATASSREFLYQGGLAPGGILIDVLRRNGCTMDDTQLRLSAEEMGLEESDGVDSFNVLLSTGAIENVSVHDDQAGAYRRVTTLRQDLCADTETSAAMAFLAVAGLQTSLTTQFAAFVGWIRANGCGVGGDEDAAVLLAHLDDDQDLLWDLIDVSMEHGLLIESEDGIALSVALCDANPDDDADALIRSIYGGDYP